MLPFCFPGYITRLQSPPSNWHDLEFHLKQAEAGVTRGRQVKMKENVQSGAQTPARLPALYLALVESVINPPF